MNLSVNSTYRAPWWLPGGDLQTLYAYAFPVNGVIAYRRERWETPDGDFIDLDWCESASDDSKLLVLFHGLEGSSQSHYALSLMNAVRRSGWRGVVPHFRGCSGELNRLPRSYHSGDSAEIDWILRRLRNENPQRQLYVVGVSLGGNMLLKWLGEQGSDAQSIVEAAATVSAPVELCTAARVLDFGHRKMIYTRRFLLSMRQKVLAKIETHGLDVDPNKVRRCSTFRAIDDLYTAPVHGFKDAEDYWTRSSSKPFLKQIQVPTLLLNALNDPFLPQMALPTPSEISDFVTLHFPNSGGHVSFISGPFPGSHDWLPWRVVTFLGAPKIRAGGASLTG